MIVVMLVSLYTSRMVLFALGVEDYGIYNVIGGLVAMFSIMTSSLTQAIGRFLTFQIGKNDKKRLSNVFATAIQVQLLLVVVVVVLSEVIGLWLLNNYLVIPSARLPQAHWVLHFSIITFCINLLGIPYKASIIAHEKMDAFAYFSIAEVALDLAVVLLLVQGNYDKLILYSILKSGSAIIVRIIYAYYCKKHFKECKVRFVFKKDILKEMGGFAGWTFIGTSASTLREHGVNILLNLFFGPIVNAAKGISSQVNAAVSSFSSNIMTAVRPQIIKSYAQGELGYMFTLVNLSARASFYLLLFLSLPVIINTNLLLGIWLVNVPDHAAWFVRLFLVLSLVESLSIPLVSAATAAGDIRDWQLIVGGLKLLDFPICYLALVLGGFPEIVLLISICMSHICLFARLVLLHKMIGFSVSNYVKDVYVNALVVTFATIVIPIALYIYMDKTLFMSVFNIFVCLLSTVLSVYLFGCSPYERKFVYLRVKKWMIR